MLSFFVFNGDQPATESVLRHASLIGPDNIPVPGEIRFENGVIHCTKANKEAAGISLQWELDDAAIKDLQGGSGFDGPIDEQAFREKVRQERAERQRLAAGRLAPLEASPSTVADEPPEFQLRSLGRLTLRTCLLPERDRPYLLSLELARHRLMLFLNKLEEWQLIDLAPTDTALDLFERARLIFTEALVAQRAQGPNAENTHGYAPSANRLALRALHLAIEASERLALECAARDFAPRVTGKIYEQAVEGVDAMPLGRGRNSAPVVSADRIGVVLPTRPVVGCTVSPSSFSEHAQRVAGSSLDFVQMPMRWVELEPTEGKYFFRNTDKWIEWAVRHVRIPVVAGPVIDFRPTCVPEWLYIWENDYDTLRELIYEHIKSIVTRYRRTIGRWTVISGVHVNDNFHFSFDQMMDLTRIAVMLVRKLHPTAKILVEVTQPWGEYYTENRRSLPPILYAEMISQAGVMVDGFGLRVQMGNPAPGQSTRDLMAFSAMLDRYAALEKPLSITAVGSPSGTAEAAAAPELADRRPGFWRDPWDPAVQADWATAAMSIALAKPYVQSVCWHELYDLPQPAEMPRGGLIGVDGTPKPAAERIADVRAAVRAAELPAALDIEQLLTRKRTAAPAT